MKPSQFHQLGGHEVSSLRDVPKPEILPGTIVVRNEIITINFGDIFFTRGEYIVKPVYPDTPGMEAAGIVDAIAPDATDFKPGLRAPSIGLGSYVAFPPLRLPRVSPLPPYLSVRLRALLSTAFLTT